MCEAEIAWSLFHYLSSIVFLNLFYFIYLQGSFFEAEFAWSRPARLLSYMYKVSRLRLWVVLLRF